MSQARGRRRERAAGQVRGVEVRRAVGQTGPLRRGYAGEPDEHPGGRERDDSDAQAVAPARQRHRERTAPLGGGNRRR